MDGSTIDRDIIAEAQASAEAADLRYVNDDEPGIRRRKSGKGFTYKGPGGQTVKDPDTLARIRALAIPPAYTDVWICPDPDGHIQATGRDAKGRKQYRYHPRWMQVRDADKFERLMAFSRALPEIRARVDADMRLPGLPREKVLACVVKLLDTTLIRIGNDTYAKENKSFGLTTLRDRHVKVEGSAVRFSFKGKSGKDWDLKLTDRRLAKLVKACQEVPGQRLFQFLEADGSRHYVTSQDVNAYIREVAGADFSAKDFRTWAGTVLAAFALHEMERVDSQAARKRNLTSAIRKVSSRLGNTPTVCRKCYVHPQVMDAYLEGSVVEQVQAEVRRELCHDLSGLTPEEVAVLAFLERRLGEEVKQA
ncbi:DNA topoisomerase IB [Aerophototrophica crusticola]|uniref:DNA topoisomerase n=1 Tax=Aerophototrophica crusticola TaxID=1709002 RepID=A0A858R840_9PROT|nr:DNA topoisomerase IB [Rhodospirillaceae bacterium B3]